MKTNYSIHAGFVKLHTVHFYAALLQAMWDKVEDWFIMNDPVVTPRFGFGTISASDLRQLIIYLSNNKGLYED